MPVKIARSAPRPAFGLLELLVAIQHLASVLLRGRKSANIHASSGVIRGIPAPALIWARVAAIKTQRGAPLSREAPT
jgi:hypothetical protein